LIINAQKQFLREAALGYLADKPTMAFELVPLATLLRKRRLCDFDFTESDLAEALAVLEGFGFVSKTKPRLGSVPLYRATAEGVVFHEQSDT